MGFVCERVVDANTATVELLKNRPIEIESAPYHATRCVSGIRGIGHIVKVNKPKSTRLTRLRR